MNLYRYIVFHREEKLKLELIENNIKKEIPPDSVENIEYNEKEDTCIITLYAENKEQAHYIGMTIMQEAGIIDREEEIKEAVLRDMVTRTIKRG